MLCRGHETNKTGNSLQTVIAMLCRGHEIMKTGNSLQTVITTLCRGHETNENWELFANKDMKLMKLNSLQAVITMLCGDAKLMRLGTLLQTVIAVHFVEDMKLMKLGTLCKQSLTILLEDMKQCFAVIRYFAREDMETNETELFANSLSNALPEDMRLMKTGTLCKQSLSNALPRGHETNENWELFANRHETNETGNSCNSHNNARGHVMKTGNSLANSSMLVGGHDTNENWELFANSHSNAFVDDMKLTENWELFANSHSNAL
ncbi:unnamed protein product [Mytilus edulis]|uniref:Uncharacterized protein n=1 Tax=Mytilus edulis TaxID=6550 RepID=A0A8S3Q7I6_MYTED|nr:unnamed protein product [Mytilus edulis]